MVDIRNIFTSKKDSFYPKCDYVGAVLTFPKLIWFIGTPNGVPIDVDLSAHFYQWFHVEWSEGRIILRIVFDHTVTTEKPAVKINTNFGNYYCSGKNQGSFIINLLIILKILLYLEDYQ